MLGVGKFPKHLETRSHSIAIAALLFPSFSPSGFASSWLSQDSSVGTSTIVSQPLTCAAVGVEKKVPIDHRIYHCNSKPVRCNFSGAERIGGKKRPVRRIASNPKFAAARRPRMTNSLTENAVEKRPQAKPVQNAKASAFSLPNNTFDLDPFDDDIDSRPIERSDTKLQLILQRAADERQKSRANSMMGRFKRLPIINLFVRKNDPKKNSTKKQRAAATVSETPETMIDRKYDNGMGHRLDLEFEVTEVDLDRHVAGVYRERTLWL